MRTPTKEMMQAKKPAAHTPFEVLPASANGGLPLSMMYVTTAKDQISTAKWYLKAEAARH